MSGETYKIESLLDRKNLHHERSDGTLEALELLLGQRMTVLEEEFRQHLDQHRAKEMETENENVKAAKN